MAENILKGSDRSHMQYADPFEKVIEEIQEFWRSEEDRFSRVCETIFGIKEFTHYTEIADKAGCSPNTARKHLGRLAMMGPAEGFLTPNSSQYRRNQAYIEWRVLRYVVKEYSMDEIIERVRTLEGRQRSLRNSAGEVPRIAPSSDIKSAESVGKRMREANELENTRRRIRLYELAQQMIQNKGHLVSRPLE